MTRDFTRGGEIVPLQTRRRGALFASLGIVETYWEGLRDGRLMPARAEVDPRGISAALEHAFILEKIAPGHARIRLAGLHLNSVMAMEVRGMPVTALFAPETRREIQHTIAAVLDTPAAVRLSLTGDSGFGRPRLAGQMVLLPLRDDTGAPTRILGALQTLGDIGRWPRRFSIADIETRQLAGDPGRAHRRERLQSDDGHRSIEKARPQEHPSRARDAARRLVGASTGRDGANKAVGHLRLVYDADALA